MGFFGREVGIPTLVGERSRNSDLGGRIPTLGGAGSAGWRLLCQAGGAPGWSSAGQGCGALGIKASALLAGWRGSDAGSVARLVSKLHVVGELAWVVRPGGGFYAGQVARQGGRSLEDFWALIGNP